MRRKMYWGMAGALLSLLMFLAGCGGEVAETAGVPPETVTAVLEEETPEAPPAGIAETPEVEETETPEAEAAETPAEGDAAAETLEIGATGTELAFTKDQLEAPADTMVQLTFDNNATGLQHNWVLVDGGRDVADQVAQAATGAPDFIPESEQIIAATETLDPGESQTISFTTPPPGEYIYLCTVPGHYQGGMWGTLTTR
ncbi:MAG: auracyanin-B [Herpetosiphonaceae bacterium]|nr:MAG: auracyanin-B [Herpetosiphonaceae bacterium]